MNLSTHTAAGQAQSPPSGQTQALDLLALTNQELEDFLVNEYLENPMLENLEHKENEIMTSIEKFSDGGSDLSYADQHPGSPDDEDRGGDEPEDNWSAQTDDQLKRSILGQLRLKDYSGYELKIMNYLIDCLDDKGFFTWDMGELSAISGYGREDLDRCLADLRRLEPAGIFSAGLTECLIAQLEAKDIHDDVLFLLVREHLADLIEGQIGKVSRRLGISTIQVKEYIHLISSLNPRPIMDIQRSEASYVIPDIIVSKSGGRWNVELNDQWMGEYKFSDYYIKLMKESGDPELTAYFKERLDRAKLVMNCVEQRRRTIIRVTEAVLKRQEDYFELRGSLSPMAAADIAGEVGLDTSTVRLAVKGKYVQYKKTAALEPLFN